MSVTLTKEQAAMLLPLLPKLAGLATTQPDTTNGDEYPQQEASYSISDMFTKKKKNARSTTAQNYLLAFLMCPKLKSYRQQLTTRLSRTLINRRLFVNRQRRKGLSFQIPNGRSSTAQVNVISEKEITSDIDDHVLEKSPSASASISEEVLVTDSGSQLPTQQNSQDEYIPVSGDTVIVVKANSTPIGKGIFLKMNSEEPFEQFSKVLFISSKKNKGIDLDVELPAKSEHGKFNFKELQKGDIFAWKLSRLMPSTYTQLQQSKKPAFNSKSSYTSSDSEESNTCEDMSPYELKRLENIARNKRKLEEIFGTKEGNPNSITKKSKKKQFDDVNDGNQLKKAKQFKKLELPTFTEPEPAVLTIGQYVAVRCDKYKERPLIGCITQICEKTVDINWMIGSYSGVWKEWKGRSEGEYVTFSDTISREDVMIPVEFTKGMRIPPRIVSNLKELYA